ncbi:TPA: glycerophosphodiester phosphodiesterase [Klebsiella variicola subsp. variicola]|uniref:glycerophosphodiester phosphodiesterase n=1 Tax=Klebsiella variicola TaxID=244366 RepID=UPI003FA60608
MTFRFHRASDGVVLANCHRGHSIRYPENTFPALQGALAAGTRCIEIDIHMTADNEFVVAHDHRIDRVSDGCGFIEQMSLAELLKFDFAARFNPSFRGTKIPLLRDVIEWAISHGVGLIVEVKQRCRQDEFVMKLAELLTSIPDSLSHIQLLGFDHVLINRVKDRLPELALQVVTLERYCDQLAAVHSSRADCVCVEYDFAHVDDLRAYKAAGLGVRLYLPEYRGGMAPAEQFRYKYGYDCHQDILGWMREGLIDMLSHDDPEYLKEVIEEAGLRWA